MPAKKQSRAVRARREAIRQREAVSSLANEPGIPASGAAPSAVASSPASGKVSAPARRVRSARAPAQIVIANYEFLRHDLRLLGVIATSLVVTLIILSFVIS